MPANTLSAEERMFIQNRLFPFLQNSPTPYHAVENIRQRLLEHHFQQLNEGDPWDHNLRGRYFLIREGTLIAFVFEKEHHPKISGWRMLGSHTDSPCLKVRPFPELHTASHLQLGVEIYGGANLGSWFDRDLSLAGKVYYQTTEGVLASTLIDLKKAIAILPNLAIHLNREINEKRSINKQTEMTPILCSLGQSNESPTLFNDYLMTHLKSLGIENVHHILGHDLRFYDTLPPQLVGLADDFISGSRLDNLLSCFVGLEALIESNSPQPQIVAFFDHEEVGSDSETGAGGPLLRRLLERLSENPTSLAEALSRSFLVSLDNAHAIHPNYIEAHDPQHRPIMNGGPVIKINANQRYATSAATESYFQWLCEKRGKAVQKITVRGDKPCGSTIGPITAHNVGLPVVDVGLPTLAMHSIRESAGARDLQSLIEILKYFFQESSVGPLS